MYVLIEYIDYGVVEDPVGDFSVIGRTIITILPSLISKDQSSLSPDLRSNCLTTLIGTVVLRDAFPVVANVSVLISPKFATDVILYLFKYINLPTDGPINLPQDLSTMVSGNIVGNIGGKYKWYGMNQLILNIASVNFVDIR